MEQHFPFLFWAYNIIWILIGAYLVSMGVRQKRVERQIARLTDALGMSHERGGPDRPAQPDAPGKPDRDARG